ncbi:MULTISPECIES: TonB-dependent receptor [unclassified Spirosoma]|uniref:SusC/RagA family TonB-linked outer membrane protein n=1 Tax=unclassified Spirosoma TaxID=2621999 RepID=UPI0009630886|nr:MULTISPECIES: TonB-dependent receptor [unclassified Spirosoma]MBN8823031.1 TonB-dependent receptor [Spirosoma sp.]OJW73130.1 MAG: SusC/RagA family TonB-linked outer membrane protein [Spirosoma sp. 48-14]
MMDKSYKINRFGEYVGQVGKSQPQLVRQNTLFGFLSMLVMLLLLGNSAAWAQGRTVTGRVTDPAGSGLPGVSVQIKGTQRGTNTDADGKYSLANVPDNATLVMSFIGYTSQEVVVGARSTVDVKLSDDTKALEEVVVVGYGTSKRKDLTGSVTQVSSKDFNAGVNPNPLQAIQGKVAGLVITSPSGDPTQAPTVRLRGYTSLAGGSDPLYVVDGMIGVPITTISPSDIESMDVLKDASAAAIYGSRAANGVILITTKRGKSGKTTVTFNNYVGLSTISKTYDMLDAQGYRDAVTQIKGAASLNDKQRFPDGNYNTNWTKEVTQNALINNHDLSIAGGSPAFSYRGSLSYINQNGIIKKTGLDRLTGRINLDQKSFDNRLNVQYNLSYTETNKNYDNGFFGRALTFLPTLPVRNPDGSYYEVGGSFDLFNPVAMMENVVNNGVQRYLQGGMNLRYEVLDGLTLGVNGQIQRDNTVGNFYTNPAIKAFAANNGRAGRSYTESNTKLLELTANYTKGFGSQNSNYSLLAGYSYQNFDNDGFQAANSGFVTSDITYNNLGLGSGTLVSPANNYATSYHNSSKLISFFGRATLNMNDKYNVTATLRRDGSSKFGANNKWGMFPSVGLGWTITNESFFPKSNTLNFLKLRAGWGQTGNSEGVAAYNSIQLYGQKGTYYDGKLGDFLPGYGITQNANPNLKWEVLTTANVGLDFQLIGGRFSGTVEYYNKLTKDMLYLYSVPADGITYFTNQILANVGSMRNSGFELSFGGDVIQKGDFSWNARVVGAYNKNTVVSLSNDQFSTGLVRFNPFNGRGLSDVYASYLAPGQPLGEFNNVPTFTGSYSADGQPLLKPGTGDTPVVDYKNSDAAAAVNAGSPLMQGNPQPFLNASYINTFRYKGFDLYFQLRGTFGNTILNAIRSNLLIPGSILETNMLKGVTDLPKNYGVNVLSSNWLESGSFVRFDNWQIGYNIPLPASKYISNARVYVGGNNLFVITKYKGVDPELQVKADLQAGSQAPNTIGVDGGGYGNTVYPKTRSFQLGLNLTF